MDNGLIYEMFGVSNPGQHSHLESIPVVPPQYIQDGPVQKLSETGSTTYVARITGKDHKIQIPDIAYIEEHNPTTNYGNASLAILRGGRQSQKTKVVMRAPITSLQVALLTTASAASGATSIAVSALPEAIPSGATVFFGSQAATLTANAASGATTLTVSALSGAIASGASGFFQKVASGTLTGAGLEILSNESDYSRFRHGNIRAFALQPGNDWVESQATHSIRKTGQPWLGGNGIANTGGLDFLPDQLGVLRVGRDNQPRRYLIPFDVDLTQLMLELGQGWVLQFDDADDAFNFTPYFRMVSKAAVAVPNRPYLHLNTRASAFDTFMPSGWVDYQTPQSEYLLIWSSSPDCKFAFGESATPDMPLNVGLNTINLQAGLSRNVNVLMASNSDLWAVTVRTR
jgi:hypothetical protein